MDITSHALSGMLLGFVVEPQPPAKERMWRWPLLGALAASLPDVDAVTALGGPDAFKRFHQLYTHNVIAFALAPVCVAAIVARLSRREDFARLWLLFQCGFALHLLGDLIAQWPLKFLYPFSTRGWSYGFIHRDFSLVIPFLLLVFAGAGFWDPAIPRRRWIGVAGLIAGTLYVLLGPGI